MIRALLDGGGFLEDVNLISRDSHVLNSFNDLIRLYDLDIVRFLSPEEYNAWHLDPPIKGSAKALFERSLCDLVRWDGPECVATPIGCPSDLSQTWKKALHDAVINADWRTPQIIIPNDRSGYWPRAVEIDMHCEPCDGHPEIPRRAVVIVALDEYAEHLCARADANPWDLRQRYPAPPDARIKHPCLLPIPPSAVGVKLSELRASLSTVRWDVGDFRYYIPSEQWDPLVIDKGRWRAGRTFPQGFIDGRSGPIDRDGKIWEWDITERHWDVQLGGEHYMSVSHDGRILKSV